MYDFGILSSRVHNAWMRSVAGRLKSDYRYSKNIVYNNFPWPTNIDDNQINNITKTAQAILKIRSKFPNSTLADLYDPAFMPADLLKAHELNDRAVLKAYGLKANISETEIVQHLFNLYEKLTNN